MSDKSLQQHIVRLQAQSLPADLYLLLDTKMAVRGYLTVTVSQASSRTKSNEVVWDDSFQEGFVKGMAACCCLQMHFATQLLDLGCHCTVEVRGGQRNIKVHGGFIQTCSKAHFQSGSTACN